MDPARQILSTFHTTRLFIACLPRIRIGPGLGIAPLDWANLTSAIHASSAGALRADLAASSATVIPMPGGAEGDEDDDQLGGLKNSIHAARGRSVLVETLRAALGGDHRDAPRGRLGAEKIGTDARRDPARAARPHRARCAGRLRR